MRKSSPSWSYFLLYVSKVKISTIKEILNQLHSRTSTAITSNTTFVGSLTGTFLSDCHEALPPCCWPRANLGEVLLGKALPVSSPSSALLLGGYYTGQLVLLEPGSMPNLAGRQGCTAAQWLPGTAWGDPRNGSELPHLESIHSFTTVEAKHPLIFSLYRDWNFLFKTTLTTLYNVVFT